MKISIRLWSYLARLFLERKVVQIKVAEKIKTHILCSVTPPHPENRAVYGDNVGKYSRAGETTDGNMAHSHFTLGYQKLQTHTQNM